MTTTEVELEKADKTEKFVLKCEQVDWNVGNNAYIRSLQSAVGDLAGGELVIGTETWQLNGIVIADVEDSDFPESRADSCIPDSDNEQQMVNALYHASKEWGPDAGVSRVFDTMYYRDISVEVVITSFNATESASDPKPGVWMVDLELAHIDAYALKD